MVGKIVLPGEMVSDKPIYLSGSYVKDGKTYASVVGTYDEEGKYVPLEGTYIPKLEDTIVGLVADALNWGYLLDINLPYKGVISARDTRLKFELGDVVVGMIQSISQSGEISLGDVKKLSRGKVLEVAPSKVPRIIGRKSSMVTMIRESTETNVIVGNNGYVWVSEAGNIPLVVKVVNEIVTHAHQKGLTDKISGFIAQNK